MISRDETIPLRVQIAYDQYERKIRYSVTGINLSSDATQVVREFEPDAVREEIADYIAAQVKEAVMVALEGAPMCDKIAGDSLAFHYSLLIDDDLTAARSDLLDVLGAEGNPVLERELTVVCEEMTKRCL